MFSVDQKIKSSKELKIEVFQLFYDFPLFPIVSLITYGNEVRITRNLVSMHFFAIESFKTGNTNKLSKIKNFLLSSIFLLFLEQ